MVYTFTIPPAKSPGSSGEGVLKINILSINPLGITSNEKDFLVYYRTELFIAAIGWFFLPLFAEARYIGCLYGLMAFIERYVKTPDEWGFSKEKIVRNTFPKKIISKVLISAGILLNTVTVVPRLYAGSGE